jgi:hypothetical protein
MAVGVEGGGEALVLRLLVAPPEGLGLLVLLLLGRRQRDGAPERGARHALGGGAVESGGREGRQLLLVEEGPLRGHRLTPRVRGRLRMVLDSGELGVRFVLVGVQRGGGWLIRCSGWARTETLSFHFVRTSNFTNSLW